MKSCRKYDFIWNHIERSWFCLWDLFSFAAARYNLAEESMVPVYMLMEEITSWDISNSSNHGIFSHINHLALYLQRIPCWCVTITSNEIRDKLGPGMRKHGSRGETGCLKKVVAEIGLYKGCLPFFLDLFLLWYFLFSPTWCIVILYEYTGIYLLRFILLTCSSLLICCCLKGS